MSDGKLESTRITAEAVYTAMAEHFDSGGPDEGPGLIHRDREAVLDAAIAKLEELKRQCTPVALRISSTTDEERILAIAIERLALLKQELSR